MTTVLAVRHCPHALACAVLLASLGIPQAWAAAPGLRCDELVPTYATPAQAIAQLHARTSTVRDRVSVKQTQTYLPFAAPLGHIRVTSAFGPRVHPVLETARNHSGIDLAAPQGTPVMAAAAGTVEFVGSNAFYGNYIVLQHADHQQTYYGHLSGFEAGLAAGQPVYLGQPIGKVGSTGLSTGPHLHFEIRQRGQPVDPLVLTAGIGVANASVLPASRAIPAHPARTARNASVAALLGDNRSYTCPES